MAEDEADIALQYKAALESRGHTVTHTKDGEDCIKEYENSLEKFGSDTKSPYDVVILDIRMPKKDGITTGKEIIDLNPSQRILFSSAYVKENLVDSIKDFQIVGVLQKPFKLSTLTTAIEDNETYAKLQNFYSRVQKNNKFDPTESEIQTLLEVLSETRNPDLWYSVKHHIIG